jgi:hypothetical protein
MQIENLAAFAPLFPATGKFNYYRAVVNFLAHLHKNPDQVNLLWRVCSVNLAREGHYYAFDEAMEIHGIKYIKQNLSHYPTSEGNLMKEIKSMQSRRERLDMFFTEFLGDHVVNTKSERAIKSRKESLWLLIDELYNAFNDSNPLSHSLFENAKELNQEGLNNMFTCYDNGIERLYTLLDVEVLENKKMQGSSMKNIARHKWIDLNKESKEKKKKGESKVVKRSNENERELNEQLETNNQIHQPMIIDLESVNLPNISSSSKSYHKKSQAEKEILQQLASCQEESLSKNLIEPVLKQLHQHDPDHWTEKNVSDYWRLNLGPRRRKKKNETEMELDETN